MHLHIAALLLLGLLLIPRSSCFLTLLMRAPSPRMSLSKISLAFDFHRIPYAAGIQHIHSPEHISETHRLGAPFFKIDSVDRPNLNCTGRTSVAFVCSTIFTKDMRVRMFSHQPNESNLIFFKDGRAMFGVKFTVIPTEVRAHPRASKASELIFPAGLPVPPPHAGRHLLLGQRGVPRDAQVADAHLHVRQRHGGPVRVQRAHPGERQLHRVPPGRAARQGE